MRTIYAALIVLLAGCNDSDLGLPDEGPAPELTGPLLAFDSAAAAAANAAVLPTDFTTPQQTVCAADTTRGFLSELFNAGIEGAQVDYEWAPIVPGPDAALPTVGQPEHYISGTVTQFERSTLDFRPPHPFGFDITPDMTVDDPFLAMVYNRPNLPQNVIHTEIQSGLYPDALFGLVPSPGDRLLYKGAWIFDCGHPPYEAELHPPTFVAVARKDGEDTIALAFANPYRATQLYGPPEIVTDFGNTMRYADPDVKPFTGELETQVLAAAVNRIQQFELHALLEATHLDPVTWFVCAPQPRPSASAQLGYSYRFVTRTGVTLSVATRGDSGCLAFHAELDASYTPAVPERMDYPWTWTEINSQASMQVGSDVDIRQLILDALAQRGFTGDIVALHPDTAVIVDQYPTLAPRPGADMDAPTEIVTGADDQPFPFYGRARVFWQ